MSRGDAEQVNETRERVEGKEPARDGSPMLSGDRLREEASALAGAWDDARLRAFAGGSAA